MKLKRIVKILILLFPITLFFGFKTEASSLPEISGENSLTINMIYKDGDIKTGISGAEIKISKIADIELSPELSIENISRIKNLNIDWFNLTAEDSNILAEKISKLIVDSDVKSHIAVTDNLGKVDFSNLQNGIYLVEESSKTGEAMKYSKIEPFFVSLPQNSIGENGEVIWTKSVIAYPKTEIEKIKDDRPKKPEDKKKKPKENPRTGDGFVTSIYYVTTILAGASLILISNKSKTK